MQELFMFILCVKDKCRCHFATDYGEENLLGEIFKFSPLLIIKILLIHGQTFRNF